MSFHNGPVTKAFMLGLGVNSFISGAFQYKHYLRLQLVPHISRHHQWWRLLTYQMGFPNSSDIFISEIILYNTSVTLERIFGSRKFGSFLFVSGFLSTTLTLLGMAAAASMGVTLSFSGPTAIIFSLIYCYSRVVPSSYRYRVLGMTFTDKSPTYLLAVFLALGNYPESLFLAAIGLGTGAACRSDMLPFKAYRLPNWVNKLAAIFRPIIGSTEPGFRPMSALPAVRGSGSTRAGRSSSDQNSATNLDDPNGMPETVTAGQRERETPNSRTPTQEEISQLTAMFPNATRMQIVNALSSTSSIEAAVERLI